MKYEAVSTASQTLSHAMELMARELTNATGSGYNVLKESLTYCYDRAYEKHVLAILICK